MLRGSGTLLSMAAILVGSGLGVALRGRLPERTRTTVTDALGLVTLVIGGLNVAAVSDPAFRSAATEGGTLLVVLGALLVGGIVGSLLRLEQRLEDVGAWLQRRLVKDGAGAARARFVEGYVSASLVFVIGPLAVLGSLSDGLGRGIDQLALKSVLDGFASLAFAASLGWGVAAAALSVGVVQGLLLLLGVGLRLLAVKAVPVGDMLPALVVAPLLTLLVQSIR